MANAERVCSTSDLQPESTMLFSVQGKEVLLVNLRGEYHALASQCTHAGAPMSEGRCENNVLICPWHGGVFDARSGAVRGGPPTDPLVKYGITVRDNQVIIDVGATSP